MIKKSLCILVLSLAHCVLGQQALRVLHANSATIDVKDGDRLLKGIWSADPTVPVDVYTAWRSTAPKTITFISDVESISFDVQPGQTYDFTILLNGKGACHTRISTETPSARRMSGGSGPTTIPFKIQHGKIHITGSLNGSPALDLMFDTGAATTVLYPSGIKKGTQLSFDGTTLNAGVGGTTKRSTSSNNKLQVGDLEWTHDSVLYIEKQADEADGIVGFDVFEDKVVEIDYDRNVLVIDDALPANVAAYKGLPISYQGVVPFVDGSFSNGSLHASGRLVIDTGGYGTLGVDKALLETNGLFPTLKVIGTHKASGVGSETIPIEEVIIPQFQLAGFTLENLPVNVSDSSGAGAPPSATGALGLNLLSRFNTILDYQNNVAYFKPNSHFNDPYPKSGPSRAMILAIAFAGIVVLAVLGILLYRMRRAKAIQAAI